VCVCVCVCVCACADDCVCVCVFCVCVCACMCVTRKILKVMQEKSRWHLLHVWREERGCECARRVEIRAYRVAKTHRMPYVDKSFCAKEPYN